MPTYEEIKKEVIAIQEIIKEYPESLQPSVFKLLVESYIGKPVSQENAKSDQDSEEDKRSDQQAGTRKRTPSKESYKILGELSMKGSKDTPSFRAFNDEKKPDSNLEFNTLAVYYLERKLGTKGITPNHIYTCYKDVVRKIPNAFKQSLYDTSNRLSSIDTGNLEDIHLTTRGENLVEIDLPKKLKVGEALSEST